MTNPQQPSPRARDWRAPLSAGLSVGLALGVARGVGQTLEPGLGYWVATAASLAVAGAVGALAALSLALLFRPGPAGGGEP